MARIKHWGISIIGKGREDHDIQPARLSRTHAALFIKRNGKRIAAGLSKLWGDHTRERVLSASITNGHNDLPLFGARRNDFDKGNRWRCRQRPQDFKGTALRS